MKRRDVLAGAGAVVALAAFPSPAQTQGLRRLTMVTDWPDGPGVLPSARRLARAIGEGSHGRIEIEVTPSGAVVRPFETFDAVQSGVADMVHTHIGYFEAKSPAFHFYSGVPFGLTANELFAWVHFGGGQALWDELCGGFGIKPLLCSSTGAQMGGWFVDEVTSVEDLRGLRYRMSGMGAEVYRRLGATAVLLPGAEIVQSLKSGAIDACEWIGPWLDTAMGLHEAASYYYTPGWQEPGAGLTLGINQAVWDSLDTGDRQLIASACTGEFAVSLAEFNANNALALRRLREDGVVRFRTFDEAMLRTFAEISRDVVAAAGSGDPLAAAIHRSFTDFRALVRDWTETAEGAYLAIPGK
ncbi:MAG TPA: TRAP transporter substrate-binding protein [Methylomirabilota bacterium]|nr:TRAP transporter substrate-binding protein [Methylomirabilota bacterium]